MRRGDGLKIRVKTAAEEVNCCCAAKKNAEEVEAVGVQLRKEDVVYDRPGERGPGNTKYSKRTSTGSAVAARE